MTNYDKNREAMEKLLMKEGEDRQVKAPVTLHVAGTAVKITHALKEEMGAKIVRLTKHYHPARERSADVIAMLDQATKCKAGPAAKFARFDV